MVRHDKMTIRMAAVLAAVLALLALLAPTALADDIDRGTDAVRIDQDGTVTLISGHIGAEGVASLRLRLNVPADAVFTFDAGLAGRMTYSGAIREGKMNLYVASAVPLMSPGQTELVLGRIAAADMGSVSAGEDALQYVYGSFVAPQTVTILETQQSPSGDVDEQLKALMAEVDGFAQDPANPTKFSGDTWGTLLDAWTSAGGVDENTPEAEKASILAQLQAAFNGLMRAEVAQALQKAAGYVPEAYESSSYSVLQAAVAKARALTGPYVTDEQAAAVVSEINAAISGLAVNPDYNGPVISDGPDGGTGSGGGEATPAPTESPAPSATPEPTVSPAPSASPEPGATPEPEASTEPTASPSPAPTATAKPAAPGGGGSRAPSTGDETVILPWAALLCLSGALLAVVFARRRAHW